MIELKGINKHTVTLHIVSGHIDIHSDTQRFDSVTYAKTARQNQPLCCFFSKMGSKIQIAVYSKNECNSLRA